MDPARMAAALARGAGLVRALVDAVDDESARWRPEFGGWSVLEIVNHLLDEEREDFRARLDLLLHRPQEPWPPIDPEGWVSQRRYAERALRPSLEAFLEERRRSLDWLASLRAPEWDRRHRRPSGDEIAAGDLLAAWVAHDSLHLRQLVRRRFEREASLARPYRTEYAGKW